MKPPTRRKRQLRLGVTLVLVASVAAIAACGSEIAGTYVGVADPEQKIVIDSSGTYTIVWPSVFGERTIHGTYEVDGESITFTLQGGGEGSMPTTLGRLEDDELVLDRVEWYGEELPGAGRAVYVRE